jgi:hypothetical protein
LQNPGSTVQSCVTKESNFVQGDLQELTLYEKDALKFPLLFCFNHKRIALFRYPARPSFAPERKILFFL